METKTIINQTWVETPVMATVENIRELAMIEAGMVCLDSLYGRFEVVESVGRVCLVSFCPETANDPVMPIIVDAYPSVRAAVRFLYREINKPYADIKAAGERLIVAAAKHLNAHEMAFLNHEVRLRAVNPIQAVWDGER